LSSFFLSEGLGGYRSVLCEDLDLFENSFLKLFVLLIADKFELSAEEADLTLVPLERAEDVFVKLDP
jgi:hypothetical protein